MFAYTLGLLLGSSQLFVSELILENSEICRDFQLVTPQAIMLQSEYFCGSNGNSITIHVEEPTLVQVSLYGGIYGRSTFNGQVKTGGYYTTNTQQLIPGVDYVGTVEEGGILRLTISEIIPVHIQGDVDQDLDVDVDDYQALGSIMGTCTTDTNFDGSINFADLLVILNNWGPC